MQFDPDRQIQKGERLRLLLSLHTAKKDMKSRWKEMCPENRKVIREEWGDYWNDSYIDDDLMCFLDYWKVW